PPALRPGTRAPLAVELESGPLLVLEVTAGVEEFDERLIGAWSRSPLTPAAGAAALQEKLTLCRDAGAAPRAGHGAQQRVTDAGGRRRGPPEEAHPLPRRGGAAPRRPGRQGGPQPRPRPSGRQPPSPAPARPRLTPQAVVRLGEAAPQLPPLRLRLRRPGRAE